MVKLGRAEDAATVQAQGGSELKPGQLGLTMRPLTREELALAQLESGLLIEGVAGPAERAGLMPGDVLLAVNGLPVKSVDQVKSVLDRKPKSVALLVKRGDARIFVAVELG